MKKNFATKGGVVLVLSLILGSTLTPLTTFAAEITDNQKIDYSESQKEKSDIKEQFNLSERYLDSIDKTQSFELNPEQQDKLDKLIFQHDKVRFFGVDDVLALIAIAGVGYGAGHWAAKEAHKRFGLSVASYKKNRWWWRAGISAAAGIPTAVGFDDYFYGI